MRKGVFIAGTDTGVGKSVVTGLLARYMNEIGEKVITQKWVQTGCKYYSDDIERHRKIAPFLKDQNHALERDIVPYLFEMPSSPHLASSMQNICIDLEKIKSSYLELEKNFDRVIVEGAGGLMVPLTEEKLFIDLLEELKLPTIVVVGNKLGAINHSLLSFEALRKRNIPILGAIYNNIFETDMDILEDNEHIIRKLSGINTLAFLDKKDSDELLYEQFHATKTDLLQRINSMEVY